jgi:hypothetical protein
MKRHPEMQLIENLRVENLIEEASHMYAKVKRCATKSLLQLENFAQWETAALLL